MSANVPRVSSRAGCGRPDQTERRVGIMDPVTSFGVVALTFMMMMYALEKGGPNFILAFAFGCAASSVYGSSQEPGRSGSSKPSGA